MSSNSRFHSSEPYNKRDRNNHGGVSRYQSKWQSNNGNPNANEMDIKQSQPNNILRLTILNCCFQVTTETLHYVFSAYGNVLRIVLFFKNGFPSAMVEFDSVACKNIQNIRKNLKLTCLFFFQLLLSLENT